MSWQDDLALNSAKQVLELERTRTELMSGLAQFHNAVRLQGSRSIVVGTAGRALACAGTGRLVGWSLRALAGAVSVTLRDSRDALGGEPIAVLELVAGASSNHAIAQGGVSFGEGLVVTFTGAGTLEGVVYLGAVD